MASIRTRKLGSGKSAYLVRFRASDGTERTKQFSRRRDAEHYAHLIEIDRAQGTFVDPRLGRITVAEWYERWWPTAAGTLRPKTRARDEMLYRIHIEPTFGTTPLGKVDRTSAREWAQNLASHDGANLAPASVTKVVQVLNKLMRSAMEDRLISTNPIERLPVPRIERTEMRYLTADEVWLLADAIDPRYRAFVLLGGYSGLRLGEMLALRWGRVDLLRRRVTVAEALTDLDGTITFGPPKTKAAIRTVAIPEFVCDELSTIPTAPVDPGELVFRSPEGFPVRPGLFRRRYWYPAVEAAGLTPLRIHDLRHTAVSLWISANANPKQVAVRAGHTSVAVVLDRYGHLYQDHDDILISALERTAPQPRNAAKSHLAH